MARAIRLPGSLSARIIVGFAVVIVTVGGISAATIVNTDRVYREVQVIRLAHLQLALRGRDLAEKQVALVDYLRSDIEGESTAPRVRHRLRRFRATRDQLLEEMHSILSSVDPPENHVRTLALTASAIEEIQFDVAATGKLYEALLAAPPIESAVDPTRELPTPERKAELDAAIQALAQLRRDESSINNKTRKLEDKHTRLVVRTAEGLENGSRQLRLWTIVWGACAVGVSLLVVAVVAVSLRPLRRLRLAAQRIAEGDYAMRIEEKGPSDVAELAREFNVMGMAVEERERELVRSERLAAVGKMAATIAHEVRNPLSSIGLNTELLDEELTELPAEQVEEARALCRSITEEVDRLTGITETYLTFARLPKPKRHIESLSAIVNNLVEFEREQLRARGISVSIDLANDLPAISVDENQIRQAVLNLLRNASDALGEAGGGTISITTRRSKDGTVTISVSDNGPGIPEEIQSRLFDPFFSTKERGTGLGLALTHQIFREHGGSLLVTSQPGKGATFLGSLPIAE